jgi:catenin alpha
MVDEYPEISGITSAREAMKNMPEPDRAKIAEQVEVFRTEKRLFDQEVSKWDDNGNDVIVMAKHMCMIMMEMTDFTRGKGPLKPTMAVINAAKKISEAGTKLDKLARQVADQCPESSTKNDLLAYLQRIALYCHQLSITSRVKADVQNVSGELIVSGLDSATSLIQAAKNLMNAVVLTVKSCYVASTKYPRLAVKGSIGGEKPKPIVVWKMKIPEKKPLVRREVPEEVRAKVRRGSQKRVANPIKALSEFQNPEDETI